MVATTSGANPGKGDDVMNELRAARLAEAKPAKRVKAKRAARGSRRPCELKLWAYSGVGLTLTASAWLNGLAFAQHAPTSAHGWALGVTIPVMILVFARVSALLYGAGRRGLSYCGAGACLSMLLLSVQHCAVSIARLTGESVALAALMALAIDVGLVVCELATIRRK